MKVSLVAAITVAAMGAWNVATGRPATAACQPAVSVKGDDEDVARIAHSLIRYQVANRSQTGCPAWQVTATRAGGQLALQIDDGHGLTLMRRVSSPDAAAAVIDSWVRRDLATVAAARPDSRSQQRTVGDRPRRARVIADHVGTAALSTSQTRPERARFVSARSSETAQGGEQTAALAQPSPPTELEAPAATIGEKETLAPPKAEKSQAVDPDLPVVNRVIQPLTPSTHRRGPVSIGLGAEASFGRDGSLWWGGRISGCVSAGLFCVGLLARGDTATLNAVGEAGTINRRGADAVAFIALPIALGRMTLLPEVGLGAGLRQSRATLTNSDPAEPPIGNGDNPANLTFGLRSTTRATLIIPLRGSLALDISGAVDGSFANRFVSTDGDSSIPGEQNLFLRGGVALRYGAP